MATPPPPAVAEALARLLKDADWLAQHGSEQDRQCIADVRTLARHLQAGAGPGGERALIDTPGVLDFGEGVKREAAHQRVRWQGEHDAAKAPEDWYWLVGYLAGKALHAQRSGDADKMRHHAISTAAVLYNWHALLPAPAPATETEEKTDG